MGGRGSSGKSSGKGKAGNAPIGQKRSMGNYKFTKTGTNSWHTTVNGRRTSNRTDSDIDRIFS